MEGALGDLLPVDKVLEGGYDGHMRTCESQIQMRPCGLCAQSCELEHGFQTQV